MPPPSGVLPAPVVQAFQDGLFNLPKRPAGNRVTATQTRWYIPVILVGFSDHPLTHTAAEFETALFDTTHSTPSGSVWDYYQWASNGQLDVRGKVVATVNLPSTRDFYAYSFYGLARESTPQNLFGMAHDALLSLPGPVDWSPFDVDHDGWVDMLWVVHQGVGGETTIDRTNLWSVTSRLSAGWRFGSSFITTQLVPGSQTQHYQIDRFTTLPELSAIIPTRRAEIGVFCHEFGHALGLPDLYDASGIPGPVGNYGPGNWSLMATGGYGGQGLTPERPSGLGGWCELFLGWRSSVRPSEDQHVALRPTRRGDPLVEFWFQGDPNPEHFLLENRHREGFDSTLPADGLLVTHLDDAAIAQRLEANRINSGLTPGLMIVEADGRRDLATAANRGEASDLFPGPTNRGSLTDETNPNTHSFSGSWTGIGLAQIEQVGENVNFDLQVRSPGWGSEVPVSDASNSQFDSGRPAHWARLDDAKNVVCVRSEIVDGRPEIVLRTRTASGWQPPETVSASPSSAYDPAIACLPGGDLAVVWTDTRSGRPQIYLRVRIRGVWQSETPVTLAKGDGHHATIGADTHGMVQVAWLQDTAGTRQLLFKRFAYFAPFGSPVPVTSADEVPDIPALEVMPGGSSYLVWSDRAASPRIYYARFSPDSGVTARIPLTFLPSGPQLGLAAAVDSAGTLHVVWQATIEGNNELHYQRRLKKQPPAPRDTVLDSAGYLLQNPSIACDDSGGIHLAYENWATRLAIPRYRLWSPSHGWDFSSTDIPAVPGTNGVLPIVLPSRPTDVSVLYLREQGDDLQLVQRTRKLGGTPPIAAVPGLPPGATGEGWRLAPNPLRAGRRLLLTEPASRAGCFEIYDLAGRRVAAVDARLDGGFAHAEIAASVTAGWAGGIYFARASGHPESHRFVVLR